MTLFKQYNLYEEIFEKRMEIVRARIAQRRILQKKKELEKKIKSYDLKRSLYRLILIFSALSVLFVFVRIVNDLYYLITGIDYEVFKGFFVQF
jgi:hypothetical protein